MNNRTPFKHNNYGYAHFSKRRDDQIMMQNQQEQMHHNMHTGTLTPQMNHGGHEILDVQEVLATTVSTMD